jgi:hypothetical protein
MKYLYSILIGIIFINCSHKTAEVIKTPTPIVEKVEESVEIGAIEVVASANVNDKTLIADEPKIIKTIKKDIPSECTMWSDGCNVCTRRSSTKASCTTYPECHNRVVSCLQWN